MTPGLWAVVVVDAIVAICFGVLHGPLTFVVIVFVGLGMFFVGRICEMRSRRR